MSPPPPEGLLLVNLGTPASPAPADVRRFLREFLADPLVLDGPALRRWLVLNLLILPFRPRQSARAYAKIWTARGSPLLLHGLELVRRVQERVCPSTLVELGMRYGRPSIPEAIDALHHAGAQRIAVFPLYPQYSTAATGSSVACAYRHAATLWNVPSLAIVPPFYDHPAYIEACAEIAGPILEQASPQRVFFSFHGLPERQIRKSDPTGGHCLASPECCLANGARCYRAQCYRTARLVAARLGVPESRSIVCFQSRLGRAPWIRPYTDEVLVATARAGVRRAAIASPAFVADCLETLEELGVRGVASWRDAGGESLAVVPALNASDRWADCVVKIVRESCPWI